MNVYIGIGNTDNKLTQQEWSAFCREVAALMDYFPMHGAWFSRPDAPWQNACWLVDIEDPQAEFVGGFKSHLKVLAQRYNQDSIAWAVAETEFLSPDSATPSAQEEA